MIILGPVAISRNNVIGNNNSLPWYIPEDLKHFRQITVGHTVLMGRKTYESIIKQLGKPLPDRTNVVVTRQSNFIVSPEVLLYSNLDEALSRLGKSDIYIIGGAEIFRQVAPQAEKMYVTHIHQDYPGDIFFPAINWQQWRLTDQETHKEFTFAIYEKYPEL